MQARTLAGAAAVAAAIGAAAVLPALAQDDTATDDITKETTTDDGASQNDDAATNRWMARHEAFAAALAEELGLDTDTVTDAIVGVHEQLRAEHHPQRIETLRERLDDAVEGGELTQEQADAILDAAESGVDVFGPHGRGGRGGPGGPGGHGHGPGHGFGGPQVDQSSTTDTA